jgi:ubiquinone/menaquinone biosynthesis C-methylase UbiE
MPRHGPPAVGSGGAVTEVNVSLPRGAVVPPPPATVEDFDRAHEQTAKSDLLWRLSNRAYGADRPTELQAWGKTTWWTLGRFVGGLRLRPDQVLLDLGCGRGGVGLWLARATNANLIGIDWSAAGIREAIERSAAFVPAGRAQFRVGDLTATGLDAESVDAAVSADAVFFATDRIAVFGEMARVLRPSGRFLFTADESDDPHRPSAVPDWAPITERGGLAVVSREEIPNWATQFKALFDTWETNIDALRAELGDQSADDLLDQARTVGPTLSRRTGVLYTTEKRSHSHSH